MAAASGVSPATVSLVLREEPVVAAATRQRVLDVIDQIGYVYDRRAANMRSNRSMTIGLIVTDIRNPFFAELSMAVEVVLQERGYALIQGYSRDDRAREDRMLGVMVEQRVDGVFLLPSKDTAAEHLQARLGSARIPHVLFARRVAGYEASYVGINNVRAGRLLAEHLATEGHRTVAFLGGPRSDARSDRLRGLRAGLKKHGLTVDENIVTSALREGGISALEQLLAKGPLPDAIAAYSDNVALAVMSGLRAAGLEPGRDVSLAGFDDVPEAALQHPALTSVATYPERVGTEASRLLLEQIEQPDLEPRTVMLEPALSVRASTTTRA
ncbi:LacI family DNA-binding transcriptional regulator [Solirubrobacter taibaiensis]|nr:LacI family DNA-binding transcriptional regulator [Solirubrobacter taibaiensis]